jgi:hypothetical protein
MVASPQRLGGFRRVFNLTTTGKTGIWFRRPRIGKSHKGAHWAEYQAGVVGGAEIATLRPDNDLQKGAGD